MSALSFAARPFIASLFIFATAASTPQPQPSGIPEQAQFVPPVSDGSGQDRKLLRKAIHLLEEAGFHSKDGKHVTPKGEVFRVEFLLDEPAFQAHHMPYIKNLGTLGIEATLRLVDPVQARARRDDFDFDMMIDRFGFSTVPGDSLRPFFSSRAAATKGSNNLAGISDPAIDSLMEQVIAADTRAKLGIYAKTGVLSLGTGGDLLKLSGDKSK